MNVLHRPPTTRGTGGAVSGGPDLLPGMSSQQEKAILFGSLHVSGSPLLLANAWDVASARVVEEAGAKAVATTSAGVAWAVGVPDGDKLGRERALAAAARVADAVTVPVTADIENGFADDLDGIAATIRGVIEAGVVGVNLEDAVYDGSGPLRPIAEQAARLTAARRAADEAGVPLFINARTDGFLLGVAGVDEALARASAYMEAGASGIFIPGLTDLPTLRALVEKIDAPVNVLVGPGSPSVAQLADVGVARISLGSSVAVAAYAVADRAARELFGSGTYESLRSELGYGKLNGLVG